eukprot:TRINITY_DN4437_c0_g1_i1.p1 TRINITY_DN4437_c0_g1~~TRINITY_DN4437_c0_g1_i1.p1  ORF type:complete len:254 (-),score=54.28 TRINITY_DN4437_c0_g1_i1:96-857(-)
MEELGRAFDFSKSTLVKDERTEHMLLMDPRQMIAVGFLYLFSVWVGPRLMQNRREFDLKGVRIVHNAALTLLSLYMTIEMLRQAFKTSIYGPIVRGEAGLGMAQVIHLYYLSKVLEFGDTWIMILRKKFDQISFLHVYHHASVLVMWWFNTLYYPGGEAYPSAWLNSFVHVWMYGYYFLSTLNYQPWWKRYITQLQISQLSLFVVQGISLLFTGAQEFKVIGLINGAYAATLVILFMQFYNKSYTRRPPQKKD